MESKVLPTYVLREFWIFLEFMKNYQLFVLVIIEKDIDLLL